MPMTELVQEVRVSGHAARRWFERSEKPLIDPSTAWEYGTEIFGHGLEGDEVRYHELSGTVLVRKDDTITTVIEEATAKPTVRRAVHHFGGGRRD